MKENNPVVAPIIATPGFLRRIAAMCYDSLLLFALIFVVLLISFAVFLPFNSAEALVAKKIFSPLASLLVSFLFLGWFWTHGGQTLGCRAWKIKVETQDQQPLNWTIAAQRFCHALLSWLPAGLGYLWMIFDKNNLAWHDIFSETRVVFDESYSPKQK